MSNELKTLKDLNIFISSSEDDGRFLSGVGIAVKKLKEELKAEAVKWVKLMNNLVYWEGKGPRRFCLKCQKIIEKSQYCHRPEHQGEQLFIDGSLQSPSCFLKHFFNLTEEDLNKDFIDNLSIHNPQSVRAINNKVDTEKVTSSADNEPDEISDSGSSNLCKNCGYIEELHNGVSKESREMMKVCKKFEPQTKGGKNE